MKGRRSLPTLRTTSPRPELRPSHLRVDTHASDLG